MFDRRKTERVFEVPICRHLLRYCEKHLFYGQQAPYKIEVRSLIGKQFMSLLIDARNEQMSGDQKIFKECAILEVELSNDFSRLSPNISKLIPINFYLHRLFRDSLITWIRCAEYHKIKPFPASIGFLDYYEIEESEYSHDAAYKHWTRYKRLNNQPPANPAIRA